MASSGIRGADRGRCQLPRVPRGGGLRCHVGDDEAGELVIDIDGRVLSLQDFGRMLRVFAGWGMRIAFVPEDRLDEQSVVAAGEPVNREE